MAIQIEFLLNECYSIDQPPILNGSNYSYWKARMCIFIQAHDYKLWKIIIDGTHTPNALVEHDKKMI